MRQKQPVKQWYKVKMVRLGEDEWGFKLFDLTTGELLPEVYDSHRKAGLERAKKNREKNVLQLPLWEPLR